MDLLKDEVYHKVPEPLKNWREMSDAEYGEAFERCPKGFQRRLAKFINRTEYSPSKYLSDLEQHLGIRS